MEWIDINDQTPICYEEGDWDGLRSEFVLVISEGIYKVARMYEGIMDGSKFAVFYTEDDFEVNSVTEWCVIRPPM